MGQEIAGLNFEEASSSSRHTGELWTAGPKINSRYNEVVLIWRWSLNKVLLYFDCGFDASCEYEKLI